MGSRLRIVLAFGVLPCLGAGCKRSAPAAPPVAPSLPPLEVVRPPMTASGGTDAKVRGPAAWLFTYAQTDGTFATTDDAEAVPAAARSVVRVVDLAPKAAPSEAAQGVYVMDLNQYLKSGRTTAKPVSRQAFETAAIAQLPPGESSAWASPAGSPGQEEAAPGATAPGASSPTAASAEAPVVTVYGTSWCGACKAARQYLAKRKVPFADKDIEKDPAAAAELQRKAVRLGVPADRVPILDVRGRLLVGFDRARLEALLGEPS